MADSFFELKNAYPDEDGDYMDLEEEYDALNDETFGSDAFVAEEDWEDTHNLLAAATENSRTRSDGHNEDTAENDVEKSLNRLVLDDDAAPSPAFSGRLYERQRNEGYAAMGRSPPMPLQPPRFSRVPTVEELERELLEGKRKAPPPVGPPPPPHHLMTTPAPTPGFLPKPPAGLMPLPRIPGLFPQPPNSTGLPPNLSPVTHSKPPGFFGPPSLDLSGRGKGLSPPGNRAPMPTMQGKPVSIFPTQPPPPIPPEMMMMRSPQEKMALRMILSNPLGYPMVPPPHHSNIMRFLPPTARNIYPHMFPMMRHDGYPRNNFHPLLQQHLAQQQHQQNMNRQKRQQQQTNSNRRNSENHDQYAKLMNNRERTWLLNIQIMQLASDKPQIDDYYYTMWKKKHPESQRKAGDRLRNGFHKDDQRKRQEPFFANNRSNSNTRERKDSEGTVAASPRVYVPLQFENSLGKLQCGSVMAPRMIIDMDVVSEPQNGAQTHQVQKDQRKTKKILLELERLYLLVIDAEDSKTGSEKLHDTTPEELAAKALVGFLNEERFLGFMCIRKGKALLLRCLSLFKELESGMLTDLWTRILKGFPTIIRRDRDDALLPKLYPFFKTWTSVADWPSLLSIARSLLSNTRDGRTSVLRASPSPSKPLLHYVLANQFGVSVVSRLLLQGELAAASLPDSETVHWKTFLEELIKNLSSLDSMESVAKPIEPIPHNILTATLNNRCSSLSTHLHVTAKKLLGS